jgi:hypothetical protein
MRRTGMTPFIKRRISKSKAVRSAASIRGANRVRIAGLVSAQLIAAAKRAAGVKLDREVIEIALAGLVSEDDFGARLVRKKGSVSRYLELGVSS